MESYHIVKLISVLHYSVQSAECSHLVADTTPDIIDEYLLFLRRFFRDGAVSMNSETRVKALDLGSYCLISNLRND